MLNFLTLILLIIQLFYFVYILVIRYQWNKITPEPLISKHFNLNFSVIIPARNEEHTILKILKDLENQIYPIEQFEVIVIDDASTDKTCAHVLEFIKNSKLPLKIFSLTDEQGLNIYKKRAIECGILKSSYPIIVTTDADCHVGPNWLKTISDAFQKTGSKMLLGPVKFIHQNGFFQAFQQMEFSGLIAVTCATSRLGHPLMCNGANIAYYKSAFKEVGGYGDDRFASGDDMFLLNKIQKKYPGEIHFIKHLDAMVETRTKQSLVEFLGQRKRWVSKNRFLPDWKTIGIGALTYAASVSLLIYFFLALFSGPKLWPPFLISLFLKVLGDGLFILSISSFFNLKSVSQYFLPCFLTNIIYTSLILPYSSLNGRYTWKGRKVN